MKIKSILKGGKKQAPTAEKKDESSSSSSRGNSNRSKLLDFGSVSDFGPSLREEQEEKTDCSEYDATDGAADTNTKCRTKVKSQKTSKHSSNSRGGGGVCPIRGHASMFGKLNVADLAGLGKASEGKKRELHSIPDGYRLEVSIFCVMCCT